MPYITGDITEASADTGIQVIIKRPTGGKIWIRRIGISSDKNIDFGRVWGLLYQSNHPYPRTYLFRKIIPQVGTYGKTVFEGKTEWPFDWDMYLVGKTQTTLSRTWWTVEFEVEPPIRKGWGQ